jgi:glyoxylase-like metal-dependent hydrolase (beta-lactamase superfamily II)
MRRTLVLGMLLIVGIGALAAQLLASQVQGQGRGGGPAFPPVGPAERVADDLFMIPGAGGNTAAFVTANGVVLVDTKLANNGQAILNQVRAMTEKPVTLIINTHTHGDHVGSNMFFPASVEIVTQENTAANMKKMPVYQEPANKPGLPDRTFKDKLTLLRGKDAIDLYYFGRAHTDGDALVVFRDRRVMHAGDMFANRAQPLIDTNNGGSGVAYGETIGKAAAAIRNVDAVITGHNVVLKWQDFVDYGEFNRLFVQHARESLKAGKTPEQAMSDLRLPDKFSGYTLTGGRGGPAGNFTAIFQELQKQ